MSARLAAILFGLAIAILAPTGAALGQVDIGFGGTPYDGDDPVEVTSDNLTLDRGTGEAVFTGNVIVVQGDLRLAAPRVEVFYDEIDGRNEIREVLATGGVLLTRGQDAAEGQRAHYTLASTWLVMTGNVLVTQGATAVAGDRLEVDMSTGNGTVSGRVRTVLDTGGGE